MKKTLFQIIAVCNILLFVFHLFSFTRKDSLSPVLDMGDKIIKVRGVVVVDSLGIERVIMGSHLPEPTFATGRRMDTNRKQSGVSGVMLYDAEGQERGGYVTDDFYGNAFLTLDSKASQQFLIVAEPQGAAAVQLWSRNHKNKISLTAEDDGADITLLQNNKNIKLYSNEK